MKIAVKHVRKSLSKDSNKWIRINCDWFVQPG